MNEGRLTSKTKRGEEVLRIKLNAFFLHRQITRHDYTMTN